MGKSLSEEQLEAQGWKLASSSAGTHLEKTLAMYRELGIETYLYRVDSQNCGDCTKCFSESGEPLYRIYTRPVK